MRREIKQQNDLIVDFANDHKLQWNKRHYHSDIYTAIYKP